jgi:endonuclease/exonuclease/phosphatase family metal-dependent hydrolase
MKKKKLFGLILLLSVIVILSGCIASQKKTQETQYNGKNQSGYTPSAIVTTSDKIKVGAFNIQRFGTTKASKPEIMGILTKIIRNYDVIAVQEIRTISLQTTLPMLRDDVNSIGSSQYEYVVEGTRSEEQYAYFYNTRTIQLMGSPYSYPHLNDTFKREPYIAEFKVKNGNFDFVLITIHAYPDTASPEINNMPKVVEDAKNRYKSQDAFIVLGDLNADCTYFKNNKQSFLRSGEYHWIINNSIDTTTKKSTDCAYDRIIITTPALTDFTGESGVFRFDTAYNLSYNSTIAVSDHYPVYANFWSNNDTD